MVGTKLKTQRNGIFVEPQPGGQWYVYKYRHDRLDWIFAFDSEDKAPRHFHFSNQRM